MKFLNFNSISSKLTMLVIFSVLPGLAILFYSGLEQRRQSIDHAKRDVLLLTHTMAEAQQEITNSTRQLLATLSLLPAIQALDPRVSHQILQAVLKQNPAYSNIVLTDLNGTVLTAGKTFAGTNLADRKHIREALDRKEFAVGEFIISRDGQKQPIFPFAYPVLDQEGNPKGVLTTAVKLTNLDRFHDFSQLPEQSFVAVTDHHGLRLLYYPARETNPIGTPIRAASWEIASKTPNPGMFIGTGSDGRRRIFAFEQVRLKEQDPPYLYVWAGVPEAHILAAPNAALARNLLLMLLAAGLSLLLAWLIGKKTLIIPVQNLVDLTRKFAGGELMARPAPPAPANHGELGVLTKAFHDMAETLTVSQQTLRENEARFRLLLDSLEALVYVTDMDTYEVLFVNQSAKKQFGEVTGKICWQSIQKGQSGPCPFCTNQYLVDEQGKPGAVYRSERQDAGSGQWLLMHDRALEWIDGRIVRLQVATDVTERKKSEKEREQLITQLQEALEKIKTLSGLLPVCAACKMIRNAEGHWEPIESYINQHSEAKISHSICPDCAKKLYPEFTDANGKIKRTKESK